MKPLEVVGVIALVFAALIVLWVLTAEMFTMDVFRIHMDCIRPPLSDGGGICLVESR